MRLVEKMGSLYTQYFGSGSGAGSKSLGDDGSITTYDLLYEGALATLTNTKPLFAALVKGLIASVSSTNVTIVNAELVAKERGIFISEQFSRSQPDQTFSSLVTLRAKAGPPSRAHSPYDLRCVISASLLPLLYSSRISASGAGDAVVISPFQLIINRSH